MTNSKAAHRTKINANTTEHGKAAAVAMLEDLQEHAAGGDQTERAISRMIGRMHPTEKPWRSSGTTRVSAYMQGYRCASARAQGGFNSILAKYLVLVTDGFVPDANSYRIGTASERKAHARVWLKGGAAHG